LVPPDALRVNAVHEIGHAVVGTALGMELVSVEIAPRLLPTARNQSVGKAIFERQVWARRTKSHYLSVIAMTLAGMASEELLLCSRDDGVSGGICSDLHSATRIAIRLERTHGMGKGLASFGDLTAAPLNEISHLDPKLLARVDAILQTQFERGKAILERHRTACERLVDGLVSAHELSGQEVLDALDEPSAETIAIVGH
jgi:cell division protease FtsH